ncbi:hypothetical protein C5167_031087, partial [Papaver somniferum]
CSRLKKQRSKDYRHAEFSFLNLQIQLVISHDLGNATQLQSTYGNMKYVSRVEVLDSMDFDKSRVHIVCVLSTIMTFLLLLRSWQVPSDSNAPKYRDHSKSGNRENLRKCVHSFSGGQRNWELSAQRTGN